MNRAKFYQVAAALAVLTFTALSLWSSESDYIDAVGHKRFLREGEPEERAREVCKKWSNEVNSHFESSDHSDIPSFAVVVTVNNGFWDFFRNWQHFFDLSVADKSEKLMLIVIAEDAEVHKRLNELPSSTTEYSTVVLPGYSDVTMSNKAEDYDGQAYKTLVSSRATHLLDVICAINEGDKAEMEGNAKKEDITIVYSDIDMVWKQNPFPYIRTKMLETKDGSDTSQIQHDQSNYDILASVDGHGVYGLQDVYCTGFLVVSQTPASIALLSAWEKELHANPQLNQPIFNEILQKTKLPYDVRHAGLDQAKFPPGEWYFYEWAKEGDAKFAKREATIVVHNNFIVGHGAKVERFKKYELWHESQE